MSRADLRIAWRSSDEWVTAFLADPDTMEGATEVLRVRKTALKSDPKLWEELQAVVQGSVHRLIEAVGGPAAARGAGMIENVKRATVCVRVADISPEATAAGSVIMQCALCLKEIYVAPSTLAGEPTTLVCLTCTPKLEGKWEGKLHPGCAEELVDWLNRGSRS